MRGSFSGLPFCLGLFYLPFVGTTNAWSKGGRGIVRCRVWADCFSFSIHFPLAEIEGCNDEVYIMGHSERKCF